MATYPYAVTNQSTTVDPLKVKKPLPTWDNSVQNVPLVPQQPAVSTDLATASNQVMNAAQNKAVGGFQSSTADLVNQGTDKLLKDPSMGKDYAAEKQLQLEQQNRGMNQQLETLRQQTAPQAYTGQNLRDLTNVAMQSIQQKADTSRNIDIEQNKAQREAAIAALTQGNKTVDQQSGLFQNDIKNLTDVRGAYEGEANRTQALNILDKTYSQDIQKAAIEHGYDLEKMDKTFGQEIATQLAQNNWQGVQNKIQDDLKLAMQSNDIAATTANIQKQIDLDKWKQETGQTFTAQQNAINNALQVSLKTMDIESSKNLMELKNKLDTGLLTQTQDFEAVQNDINRQLQVAMQKNDIASQYALTDLKGQIEAAAQKSQQEFTKVENQTNRMFSTSERLSTQDFDKSMKYIDVEAAKAQQAGDFEKAKYLQEQGAMVQLKMQTNEMDHTEKMAYINDQLATAKANGDVGRQLQILTFQHAQEMDTILQSQGFEKAMQYSKDQLALAMQNKDFVQATALQANQLKFQGEEAAKDRVIEQAKLALQEKGVNMAEIEQKYNEITAEIEAGRVAPDAAVSYLKSQMAGSGIDLKAIDSGEAALQAIDADYKYSQYQYAKTHLEMSDGKGGLTEAGLGAFAVFYNKSIYGETGTKTATDIAGMSSDSPEVMAIMAKIPLTPSLKDLWSSKGDAIKGTDALIKITDPQDPSKSILVTYDTNSRDMMLFTALDGRKINAPVNGGAPTVIGSGSVDSNAHDPANPYATTTGTKTTVDGTKVTIPAVGASTKTVVSGTQIGGR